MSRGPIFSIHEDRRGNLWIGTQGGGLNRWDLADRRAGRAVFKHYTERGGLPNNTIYGILEDEEGSLWLSTNRGLSKLDPQTGGIRNYDTTHGLQSNEFNFGAHYRSAVGEMFFGGNNGFNAFFPGRIRINTHVPPVVLTSFLKLNKRTKLEKHISDVKEIQLTHRDYVVSFEFAALDYAAPEKNRYAYKLVGLDRDWTELPGARRATYTNLGPGHYVFRVKGANSDGVWNEQGFSLGVTVLPPPWRTWWAYTFYVLLLLGIALAFRQSHVRKLASEAEYNRILEQQVKERTAQLAERYDELQLANAKLEDASVTDSLTGLGNRRFLTQCIQKEIAMVERSYGAPDRATNPCDLVLMMIDLDGLKTINDTYGHSAGDMALIQMRELLEKACRKADMILRWGGDEFLVVGRYADRELAKALAERIRVVVKDHPFDLGLDHPVYVSASIGFAFYPFIPSAPTRVTWEQVVTIADRALYGAKASGRNAWVGIFSTPATPLDAVHLISHMPELLAREGRIEVQTSVFDREVAWTPRNYDRDFVTNPISIAR
jgi:diguanylate cyclase (GGDEF)-like protein